MKKDENGQLLEPVEEVVVDVDEEFSGVVVEKLGQKRAELIEMIPSQVGNKVRLIFHAPSRGLIGYHSEFLTDTRGTGVMLTNLTKAISTPAATACLSPAKPAPPSPTRFGNCRTAVRCSLTPAFRYMSA